MQREEQPYLNRLIDLTLLTPRDTEKGTNTSNAVQHTQWTICASVNLELETRMALQIWMCLAHIRRQYRKIAGIRGAKSNYSTTPQLFTCFEEYS